MTDTKEPARRRNRGSLGERETLESFLDDFRDIVVRKASGLSDDHARRRLFASQTTVGGLIKHLRWAEYGWFDRVLSQQTGENLRTHERSWEFEFLPEENLERLIVEYVQQCDQSRINAGQHSLEDLVPHARFGPVSLRWIYVHMIEETARHAGHLDILREQLDGAIGFD